MRQRWLHGLAWIVGTLLRENTIILIFQSIIATETSDGIEEENQRVQSDAYTLSVHETSNVIRSDYCCFTLKALRILIISRLGMEHCTILFRQQQGPVVFYGMVTMGGMLQKSRIVSSLSFATTEIAGCHIDTMPTCRSRFPLEQIPRWIFSWLSV